MISSAQNAKIKLVRELLSSRKRRKESGLFVIEGVRMAEEALEAGLIPEIILYSQMISQTGMQAVDRFSVPTNAIAEVSADLLNRVSDTRHSQGVLLVLPIPRNPVSNQVDRALALDNIHDPGNMGTILRSAAAFGFKTIFLTPGCTDPYSPKVARAGMGAHFKVTLQHIPAEKIVNFCKNINQPPLAVLLADAENGRVCWESDLTRPLCLFVGSEAQGAAGEIHALTDEIVSIPMLQDTESYNAAVSASILMYEIHRQRKSR